MLSSGNNINNATTNSQQCAYMRKQDLCKIKPAKLPAEIGRQSSPGPTPHRGAIGSRQLLVDGELFFFGGYGDSQASPVPVGGPLPMHMWATVARFSGL